jgi:protein-S-isoprenylcysteine O-methyltransferase Ste14
MENKLKDDPRYQNHGSRPDLAGEHPLGDGLQLVALIIFAIGLIFDHLFLGWASNLRQLVPITTRLISGGLLIMFGAYLAIFGIRFVFSDYTQEPRMYSSGFFSRVRHPIYLGVLIVYGGVLLIILSPVGVGIFIAICFLYNWLAEDEEERMTAIFGSRYRTYIQKTPRWLPIRFTQRK